MTDDEVRILQTGIAVEVGKLVTVANERIDAKNAQITRLTSFLERIRDGRICRRCLKFPLEWRIYDEDGRKHSCERENAREALDEMP